MKAPVTSRYRHAVILAAVLTSLLLWQYDIHAQRTKSSQRAGEQVKAEKGLRDNRYFFYFINSSISNFGSDEEKRLFKEAIQRDILAQLLFMRFQFHEAFTEIRKSQKLLVNLYGITLKRDIGASKSLLDEFAPAVIESKDHAARTYLWLGYRDMKSAGVNMLMGDNFREALYSMRLYQYVKAIKLAKHGKRFALLAKIEQSAPSGNTRGRSSKDFDEIDKEIQRIFPPVRLEYYRRIHMDNYYRSGDAKSFYDIIWDNPAIQDLEEYRRYLSSEDLKE
jgi:hypothetical protein